MKTITLQIGNSDDKLTQYEWSLFHGLVNERLNKDPAITIHFSGCSDASKPWQNACWIFVCHESCDIADLKGDLVHYRDKYRQDSIAWTEGDTAFV